MRDLTGKIGIWASVLCGVHCMAMPLVISFLPLLGISLISSWWFDVLMLLIAVGMSTLSLCWGYAQHGKFHPFWFIPSGIMWFLVSWQAGHNVYYSLIGGFCFIAANISNRYLCRACTHCHQGA